MIKLHIRCNVFFLAFLMGVRLNNMYILFLWMWKTTCLLHRTLKNKTVEKQSVLSVFIWRVILCDQLACCLSIDQCFVLDWWRALLTLSIPFWISCREEYKSSLHHTISMQLSYVRWGIIILFC